MGKLKRAKTYTTKPSDKHDILYSKARYVLNQRCIKRPWFNLNPFLEKTDESLDLENYLPEESKYIQHLESLVLCESYNNPHPVDTRELAVETFFEYLYSDSWTNGCSIRVLEGQLLDQLLVCLYRLEREKETVRHTTYAFARNRRHRTGCYKLADKSYGYINETLLIEFAYFGRLLNDEPNTVTQKPLEYLRHGRPEFTDEPGTSDVSITSDFPPKRKRAASINAEGFFRSINGDSGADSPGPPQGRNRRMSLMSKPLNAIRFLQSVSSNKPRRMSVIDSTTSGTPMSVLQGYSFGAGKLNEPIPEVRRTNRQKSLDMKADSYAASQLLKKFPLQKFSKQAVGESNDDKHEDESDTSDEDEFYGEEFYLCDERIETPVSPEPVGVKLKRKKVELQQRRQERREMLESLKVPDKPLLPPLPPLTSDEESKQDILHYTINMPDEVPTFEEFIRLLKDDEYYDPRYRNKVRLKSKKIAQRYYIAKGQRRNSHMFEMNNMPGTLLDSLAHFNAGARRKSNASDYGSRVTVQLPTLKESERGLPRGSRPDTNYVDPSGIADDVWGVTDSEACRDHCLDMGKYRDDRPTALPEIPTGSSRRSATNVTRLMVKQDRSELPPILSASPEPHLHSYSPVPPLFPKVALCDEEIEYPDSDDEESDTDEEDMIQSDFDASKLNIKYSVERLRKKKRRMKKKPVFYDILAKYYKMQNAMTAFRKNSMTREIKNAKSRAKRLSLAGYLRGEKLRKPVEEFVLGKLRKFNFLEPTPKRLQNINNVPTADFSVPRLQKFMDKLKGSIDDFVVRREIVVSDLQVYYKSATSVTFTKKSCFQNKHTMCNWV